MAGPILELENVNKSFGATTIIPNIDLDIEDGEFVVFVGPSGCGKTTALRMVAGLEPITSGKVRIGDRVVNDLPPKNRDVAMVFQNYALYPHMSAYKNMAFGLKLRDVPRGEIDRRVKDAAQILGLGEVLATLREALTTRYEGLKVIIAKGECQLERQRRERPRRAPAAAQHDRPADRFGRVLLAPTSPVPPAVHASGTRRQPAR